MRIKETFQTRAIRIVDNINNKSKKYHAIIKGFMTKNMSLHCETIKIKENKCFGRSMDIDVWESGLNDTSVNIDDYKDMIEEFERLTNEELIINT